MLGDARAPLFVLVELARVNSAIGRCWRCSTERRVTDVARRYGVVRQTVHDWLRKYAASGLAALAGYSSKAASCPHQMDPEIEARVVDMRRGSIVRRHTRGPYVTGVTVVSSTVVTRAAGLRGHIAPGGWYHWSTPVNGGVDMGEHMTDLTTEPPSDAPKEPRRWKTWQLVTASVLALLIGVGIGGAGGADDDPKTESASSSRDDAEEEERTTTTARRTTTTRRATTTTLAPYVPAAADFAFEVVVTEKDCFGSAGCNVTYELDLIYNGPRPLDPSSTFLLIYEVRGGDETEVGNIELDGDGSYSIRPETIGTPSSESELVAVVTSVRER